MEEWTDRGKPDLLVRAGTQELVMLIDEEWRRDHWRNAINCAQKGGRPAAAGGVQAGMA